MVTEYRVDPTDLHLSGLEAFTFDYVVKWPVSLVISRKVCLSVSLSEVDVDRFIVHHVASWRCGRASDLLSTGCGFEPRPGTRCKNLGQVSHTYV